MGLNARVASKLAKSAEDDIHSVHSCYLEVQGTLLNTSRSVPRHIRFAEMRKNRSNSLIAQINM